MITRATTNMEGYTQKMVVKLEFLMLLAIASAWLMSENVEASCRSTLKLGTGFLSPKAEKNEKDIKDTNTGLKSYDVQSALEQESLRPSRKELSPQYHPRLNNQESVPSCPVFFFAMKASTPPGDSGSPLSRGQ
ncbi:hypothetical protein Mapa_005246 [Marchantia paleacea]|nr:hypothetical protein Mapa_005246 [Marchantia paleacea]